MKDRTGLSVKGGWCPTHKTRDPKLHHACAYCGRQTHFHTGQIILAKRSIYYGIICSWCRKSNRLVVAYDGKRWELAVVDQGVPAKQTKLDLKVR